MSGDAVGNLTSPASNQHRKNLDRLDVYLDSSGGRQPYDQPSNLCGSAQRLTMVDNPNRFQIHCLKPMIARYAYIVTQGQLLRSTRLFSAVICEVIVYG